jgi:hypothetical protein
MNFLRETEVAERRRAPRLEPHAAVHGTIFAAATGQLHPTAIRDVSQTGIALLAQQAFEVGALLAVELHHIERGIVRRYMVEVCHSDICYPDDSYLHGCRFVVPLSEEEWRMWL